MKLLNDPTVIALIERNLEERRSHSQAQLEEAALKMLVEDDKFAGKVFDKALDKK